MANRNLCRYDDDDDDDRDDEEEKGPIKGVFIKENNLGGVEYTRACNDQFHSHPLSVQVEEKRKEIASRAADELVDHKERKATATGTPWIPDGTEAERKKEREKEGKREEGGANEVAARQDPRGNANSAPLSNTPGTLSKSDNFRGEGNSERGEVKHARAKPPPKSRQRGGLLRWLSPPPSPASL